MKPGEKAPINVKEGPEGKPITISSDNIGKVVRDGLDSLVKMKEDQMLFLCGKCNKVKKDNREQMFDLPDDKELRRKILIDLENKKGVVLIVGGEVGQNNRWAKVSLYDEHICKCGRPTKYTPELLAACREYLELKMPNKDTEEVIHSVEGLCDYPGVDIGVMIAYEWVKDPEKEEFSKIMMEVMRKQGKKLLNKGLDESFSGRITTLLLSKHGYRNAVDNFNREVAIDPNAQAAGDKAIEDYLKNKK